MDGNRIRAVYDEGTITVYQAYNEGIAKAAVKAQAFVSPFKKERMTWIKPSFLWMMYRCGWATKENQEHVLAIRIKREGFEWALQHSCLSHFDKGLYDSYDNWKEVLSKSPVRIQWDPEKDLSLNNLAYRSIQIGLSALAVEKYVSDWISGIEDITGNCKIIHSLINEGKIDQAKELLPVEKEYAVASEMAVKIGML